MNDAKNSTRSDPAGAPPRPGLVTTPLTQRFWDAANDDELLIQRCRDCGHRQHYPRNICTGCWSEQLEWQAASGRGTVWTFTVVEKPGHPAWAGETPYTIALVELEEGPRLMTRLIDCAPDGVAVGMDVVLRPTRDEQLGQTLITFAPAASD
ncbi:Zn-ribbon domain-containing OB-fold protein [Leucobacter sp. wl10]|nr:Zn-ribbon domain-containing OB-fold protein [Leucobacter sp. wl10]